MHLAIELTAEERALLERIKFDPSDIANPDEHHANGDAVVALMKSLNGRRAIPEHRVSYFSDPSFYVGGHGKSHQQIFEKNGCRGDDILRDAHFLPYLRYMLFGADLPQSAISAFASAVADCGQITSGDAIILSKAAKDIARANFRDKRAAEEFFKLALDTGLEPDVARYIRDAVATVR